MIYRRAEVLLASRVLSDMQFINEVKACLFQTAQKS